MKQELYEKVRTRYDLGKTTTDRNFFSKKEMMEIVNQIYGKEQPWTQGITYMTDCLTEHGWSKQATTDTHPNRENLQWLLDVPMYSHPETTKTYKYNVEHKYTSMVTLREVLDGMDPKVMEKVKGVSIDKSATTITLKF